jgi:hypothetical protein
MYAILHLVDDDWKSPNFSAFLMISKTRIASINWSKIRNENSHEVSYHVCDELDLLFVMSVGIILKFLNILLSESFIAC